MLNTLQTRQERLMTNVVRHVGSDGTAAPAGRGAQSRGALQQGSKKAPSVQNGGASEEAFLAALGASKAKRKFVHPQDSVSG